MGMLKFKDLSNKSYEIDVKNDNLVIDVKRKLSKKIDENYKNIVLMFKNEILLDDKLINDYMIESNQFVLWFKGKDCMRYSNDDSETMKCITIIDNCNDDEYFVNMNKYSTVRMLKSIITKKYGLDEEQFYLEFNKNKLSIDNNATLEQCGFRNGCDVKLIYNDMIKVKILNKYFRNFSETFEYNLSKYSTVGQLKQICAEKTNIELNKFSLQFNEKSLLDDDVTTLMQCKLINGCTIELDSCHIILLYLKYSPNCYAIYANKYCSVGILKQQISQKISVAWKQIKLHYNDAEMSDDYRLNDYWINNGDTLNMTILTSPWNGIWNSASMIPLSKKYESFAITEISDMTNLINKICKKFQLHDSLIKLYSDSGKINQIKDNRDLRNVVFRDPHNKLNTIYYLIIPKKHDFELMDSLDQGSFGKVYKCKNEKTKQMLALKKFDWSTDLASIKDKFQMGIDCYFKLKSHPRIIKYENHFIKKHSLSILMEYMERGSLGSYVKGKGPFPEHIIAKFARQILEGLEYLHYNRILHRDLKGDNILLDENNDLKLCDFGLAKILTDLSSEDFLNGVVQSTVATLNWMSPEIISGEHCGPASDIWSFGATMVEIITRRHPYHELPIGKMVPNILAGQMKFNYPPNSSDDMKLFINSCLKRNYKERAKINQLFNCAFLMKNLNY